MIVKKFGFGHCSICGSENLEINLNNGTKVVCKDCHNWTWFEDAVDSLE